MVKLTLVDNILVLRIGGSGLWVRHLDYGWIALALIRIGVE